MAYQNCAESVLCQMGETVIASYADDSKEGGGSESLEHFLERILERGFQSISKSNFLSLNVRSHLSWLV